MAECVGLVRAIGIESIRECALISESCGAFPAPSGGRLSQAQQARVHCARQNLGRVSNCLLNRGACWEKGLAAGESELPSYPQQYSLLQGQTNLS